MGRLARWGTWLCLGMLVTACAFLQAQDFQQAVDHLSQTDVVARWGLPQAVVGGTEGETLWLYTVRAHVWAQPAGILVTSPGWVTPGGWRCTQYLFRFDRLQVLRGWTARRCCMGRAGPQAITGVLGSAARIVGQQMIPRQNSSS